MKVRIEQERIPANEDPEIHLKLGPGSLSDIEWTVQLLQLRHGLAGTNTLGALDDLVAAGHMPEDDAAVLVDSYRFCEHTRNRSFIVTGPGDALPHSTERALPLVRPLGTPVHERHSEVSRVGKAR